MPAWTDWFTWGSHNRGEGEEKKPPWGPLYMAWGKSFSPNVLSCNFKPWSLRVSGHLFAGHQSSAVGAYLCVHSILQQDPPSCSLRTRVDCGVNQVRCWAPFLRDFPFLKFSICYCDCSFCLLAKVLARNTFVSKESPRSLPSSFVRLAHFLKFRNKEKMPSLNGCKNISIKCRISVQNMQNRKYWKFSRNTTCL